jgi:hypothetical protein
MGASVMIRLNMTLLLQMGCFTAMTSTTGHG